jgi:oligopeptidase B
MIALKMRWTFALLVALVGCAPAAPPAPAIATTAPIASAASSAAPVDDTAPKPPVAKKVPHATELHGETRIDDYYWLRNKGTPEVESYLAAENAYTDAMTKASEPIAKSLYDEMLARVQEDDTTPPVKDGAYRYYARTEKGKQYTIHCRARIGKAGAKDGPEEILLDLNALAATERFVDVRHMRVSDDDQLLAYLVDTQGFRQYVLKVKNLRTGAMSTEAIARVREVEHTKDNRTLYYVTEDAVTKRANKLFRHTLGEDAAKDVLVYEEKDEMFDVELGRTLSKAYLTVTISSHTTSEVRLVDAARPTAPPRLVAAREHDHEYYVDHRGDLLYIRTNSGGRNFRLVTAPAANPSRANWKELIAHRDDVMLEEVVAFRDHMILAERKDAVPRLSVFDYATKAMRPIDQPEPTYDAEPDDNREFGATTFRFRYESHKTPATIIDYDVKTADRRVLKVTPVVGYDASQYETARLTIPARDGTPIPVSLVFRKGKKPDGTHPLYLYAYGSYGYSAAVTFKSERVSLLDRGFVSAVAHVRGGGDNGKRWHDLARMKTKMNTFTDYIDVAEGLKKAGWANAIVAAGGSAGGLLMGAVTNMRPDLFSVVMAYVPFVDVINTMLDESLPLTVSEFEEWGNPKKKDEYEWIRKYSPYDNVEAKAYPTMLVRTSYNDSQVMYWEPAKWVAKLRAMKTDKNPLLFKINMQPAGHGGQSGRYDRLHDAAFDYAFVLTQLGVR